MKTFSPIRTKNKCTDVENACPPNREKKGLDFVYFHHFQGNATDDYVGDIKSEGRLTDRHKRQNPFGIAPLLCNGNADADNDKCSSAR